ncbi:neurofilament medium polypeptide [Ditylenchus destructor]|uniref:Neurofilament medium polypeptide n=1 Tax=Ditylenchus destructor TaxID=166010 RepID=A0AAD4NGJ0_9BILA|nr:neurofilament medium polypeptide [Ditylenchus destructor]
MFLGYVTLLLFSVNLATGFSPAFLFGDQKTEELMQCHHYISERVLNYTSCDNFCGYYVFNGTSKPQPACTGQDCVKLELPSGANYKIIDVPQGGSVMTYAIAFTCCRDPYSCDGTPEHEKNLIVKSWYELHPTTTPDTTAASTTEEPITETTTEEPTVETTVPTTEEPTTQTETTTVPTTEEPTTQTETTTVPTTEEPTTQTETTTVPTTEEPTTQTETTTVPTTEEPTTQTEEPTTPTEEPTSPPTEEPTPPSPPEKNIQCDASISVTQTGSGWSSFDFKANGSCSFK